MVTKLNGDAPGKEGRLGVGRDTPPTAGRESSRGSPLGWGPCFANLVDHVSSPELATMLLLETSQRGTHGSGAGLWGLRQGGEAVQEHPGNQALRNSCRSATVTVTMGPHWGRGGSPGPTDIGDQRLREGHACVART